MQIEKIIFDKNENIWIGKYTFQEKDIPKKAGFRWDPIKKRWWSNSPDCVLLLEHHCNKEAKESLLPYLEKIDKSRDDGLKSEVVLKEPKGLSLFPFQKIGVEFCLKQKGTLLADDMGLGKSPTSLSVVNNDENIKSVIIVCPASLRLNWLKESKRWLLREWNFYVVEKNEKIEEDINFVIVNYDMLKENVLESLINREWDCLIVDEAHFLKNPKTKRTKTIFGYWDSSERKNKQGLIHKIKQRTLFLTGTPILNKPIEIFPLLKALDPKTWNSSFKFGLKYCNGHQKYGHWDFTGASNLEDLQTRLRSTLMIRRLKKDVLKDLPSKQRQIIVLPSDTVKSVVKKEMELYKRIGNKIEELTEKVELAKISNNKQEYDILAEELKKENFLVFSEIAKIRKETAIAKIPFVIEHINEMLENNIKKIVVFAHHHEVIDNIKEAFSDVSVVLDGRTSLNDRQKRVDSFQENENCKIFIGGIKAAGVGITLTASSNVVFAELDWTPSWITQCEDRCNRISQENQVLVQHLVLDGSLDANMVQTIVRKQEIYDKALDTISDRKNNEELGEQLLPRKKKFDLPKEFPNYSEEEKKAIIEILQYLASSCDGSMRKDNVGFNKFDSNKGKILAEKSKITELTNGELWYAKQFIKKYRAQYSKELYQIVFDK